MSEISAWMPMYWGDYLADTMELSVFEHGAYLLLIGYYWRRGGPIKKIDAPRALKISRQSWKNLYPRLSKFFIEDGEYLRHKRVDAEISKSLAWREKSRIAGKKSAEKRLTNQATLVGNVGSTLVQPPFNTSPSQPQSPKKDIDRPSVLRELRSPNGSRLPRDWLPGDELNAWTRSLGLDPAAILPTFRDYWTAAAGAKGRKSDWPATWRNWCRKEAERKPRGPNGTQNVSRSRQSTDAAMRAFASIVGEGKAEG